MSENLWVILVYVAGLVGVTYLSKLAGNRLAKRYPLHKGMYDSNNVGSETVGSKAPRSIR